MSIAAATDWLLGNSLSTYFLHDANNGQHDQEDQADPDDPANDSDPASAHWHHGTELLHA
jgi:hypothetical protein